MGLTAILAGIDMNKKEQERQPYFQEALADFMHDAASGGAIRHLLELGYTTDGIMKHLDFPTPRSRVEKTVYQYLTSKRILLEELPIRQDSLRMIQLEKCSEMDLYAHLRKCIDSDGETNSYVSCPFGTVRRDRETRLKELLSSLTTKEREYLMGIPWQPKEMYHRLNSRMLEISVRLAVCSTADLKFYFLKRKELLTIQVK